MWINIMIWCRRQTRTGVRRGYCLERELHDSHERPQIRPMTCKLWIERIVSDRHGTFPYTGCSALARSRSSSMLAKCTSSSRCKWGTTPAYRRGALALRRALPLLRPPISSYFEGVQGEKSKQGELFGIRNIFKLHESTLATKMAVCVACRAFGHPLAD